MTRSGRLFGGRSSEKGRAYLYSNVPRHMMSIAVLSATVTRARSALLDNWSSGIARLVALHRST